VTRWRTDIAKVDGVVKPELGRVLPLWLTVVLGVAGAAAALWGMHAAAPVLGPVILAFVLTVVAHPIVGGLTRRGMRRGFAVAIAVLAVDGGLVAFCLALVFSFGRLATVLPQYADQWQDLLNDLRSTLVGAGIGPDQVDQALHSIEPRAVISAVAGLVTSLAGSTAALILVLATVLFMTAEGAGVTERLAAVPGTWRLRTALGNFARNTRRYIVVTTIFGLLVAVVDTVALVLLGVPLALLWGLLSFLTNYVPNIGFFLGLAPPALLALLVGGPRLALLVIAAYALANFILQSVVQPVFVGDAVGLSVTLSFLSVIVWTVVLGPMGAVLAIPLTLFVHAILVGQDPDRRWAAVLLAGTSCPVSSVREDPGRPLRPQDQQSPQEVRHDSARAHPYRLRRPRRAHPGSPQPPPIRADRGGEDEQPQEPRRPGQGRGASERALGLPARHPAPAGVGKDVTDDLREGWDRTEVRGRRHVRDPGAHRGAGR
jgi:predicted PurR-regulated permease PerM